MNFTKMNFIMNSTKMNFMMNFTKMNFMMNFTEMNFIMNFTKSDFMMKFTEMTFIMNFTKINFRMNFIKMNKYRLLPYKYRLKESQSIAEEKWKNDNLQARRRPRQFNLHRPLCLKRPGNEERACPPDQNQIRGNTWPEKTTRTSRANCSTEAWNKMDYTPCHKRILP